MKRAWFVCILLLTVKFGFAQDACPEFPRLMAEAKTFASNNNYQMALNKYNSAKTYCPGQRAKVDSMVKQLFKSIQIVSAKNDTMYRQLRTEDSVKRVKAEQQRENARQLKRDEDIVASQAFAKISDSEITSRDTVQYQQKGRNTVINTNTSLGSLPLELRHHLRADFISLTGTGKEPPRDSLIWAIRHAIRDSLISAIRQLTLANYWTEQYKNCLDSNEHNPIKLTGANDYISFFGSRLLEYYYYLAAFRLENASRLLPSIKGSDYADHILKAEHSLDSIRIAATRQYYIPEKIVGLPWNVFSYDRSADNANFVLSYIDDRDYNKLQFRCVNYSLPGLVPTVDSSRDLIDSGTLNTVLATCAGFKYTVGKALRYVLKKNNVQIKDSSYVVPTEMTLFENTGKIITRFDPNLNSYYYFSPDGRFVVTWDPNEQLLLYNISLKKLVPLIENTPVRAMSISTDSRTIAYYNFKTRTIYFSHTDGQPLDSIRLTQLGQTDLADIEFTGSDHFLRLNTTDSIFLLDMQAKKIVMSFSSKKVQDILVSPSGGDILLNCNITYNTRSNNSTITNYENLALLVDKNLHLKGKLLGDVQNLLFTPDGNYVIGYNSKTLVRWNLNNSVNVSPTTHSCLSMDELIDKNYLPYSRYAGIDDASQIEAGARALMDLVGSDTDVLVRSLYYRESQHLFDRLAAGDAKNIRPQRLPFFLDWHNWIEQRLGSTDFNSQFYRQKAGTELFDKMVNSPDSIYPRLLFYAANSHLIFGRLYESLHYNNQDFLDLIAGEIALRQRVLLKDPSDSINENYLGDAYIKFSSVCDSMGNNFTDYSQRLSLFRMAEDYLSNGRQEFYDTLTDRKLAYANVLSYLASNFIYAYISGSNEYKTALDSASYYANKGLQIAPSQGFVVYFVMEEAFAHLLKDEAEQAIDVCRKARGQHPEIKNETMREVFQFFKRNIGYAGSTVNTDPLEKYIEQVK